jgi:hypothetical protein
MQTILRASELLSGDDESKLTEAQESALQGAFNDLTEGCEPFKTVTAEVLVQEFSELQVTEVTSKKEMLESLSQMSDHLQVVLQQLTRGLLQPFLAIFFEIDNSAVAQPASPQPSESSQEECSESLWGDGE